MNKEIQHQDGARLVDQYLKEHEEKRGQPRLIRLGFDALRTRAKKYRAKKKRRQTSRKARAKNARLR